MNSKIGFIGLGNVGAKLAGSLLRNGFPLIAKDLDRQQEQPLHGCFSLQHRRQLSTHRHDPSLRHARRTTRVLDKSQVMRSFITWEHREVINKTAPMARVNALTDIVMGPGQIPANHQ